MVIHHTFSELAIELRTRKTRQLNVKRLLLQPGLVGWRDAHELRDRGGILVSELVILDQHGAKVSAPLDRALLLRQLTDLHLRQVALDGLLDELFTAVIGGPACRNPYDRKQQPACSRVVSPTHSSSLQHQMMGKKQPGCPELIEEVTTMSYDWDVARRYFTSTSREPFHLSLTAAIPFGVNSRD